MWVWAIAALAAILIWLLIAGAYRLATGYIYTKRSLVMLGSCALLGIVAGAYLGFSLLTLPLPLNALAALFSSLPFFIILANLATWLWVRRLLRDYDFRIEQLLEAEYNAQQKLEASRDLMHMESIRQEETRHRNRTMFEKQQALQEQVFSWQQSGGVARVRALRVDEWKASFQALDGKALSSRRKALVEEVESLERTESGGEVDRLRQMQVLLALLDLEVMRRSPPSGDPNVPLNDLVSCGESLKAQIESIRSEVQLVRRKRSDATKQRIRLE